MPLSCMKNGVPCTVNKGFWQPKPEWFTVVGTTGFERTRDNPDYARYLQTIANVSKEFAAKTFPLPEHAVSRG